MYWRKERGGEGRGGEVGREERRKAGAEKRTLSKYCTPNRQYNNCYNIKVKALGHDIRYDCSL